MKSLKTLTIFIISTLIVRSATFLKNKNPIQKIQESDNDRYAPGTTQFYLFILYSFLIVLFAGTMSGLSVGFCSIDYLKLEILLQNGTKSEKRNAKKILPILKNKHLLLSTLLLANAAAMESLPLFLDAIMPAMVAVILSTSFVLIFGEIVPQALCLGENQLKIAAFAAPLVKLLICIFWIICYPISKILDCLLGQHDEKVRFGKKDLKALVQLHQGDSKNEALDKEEVRIIHSTIDIRNVSVGDILVKKENIFSLTTDTEITSDLIKKMKNRSYSKIPIFKNEQCIGFLKTKKLLDLRDFIGKKIVDLGIASLPIHIFKNTNLLEALRIMQESKQSALIVRKEKKKTETKTDNFKKHNYSIDKITFNQNKRIIGFVFLKDIFEEIIKKDIEDDDLHCISEMENNHNHNHNKLKNDKNLKNVGNEKIEEVSDDNGNTESEGKDEMKKPLLS